MEREMNESSDPEMKEKIVMLREVTRLTGALHESQLLQLKMWPKILFGCQEHTISYDNEARTVSVDMKLAKKVGSKKAKDGAEAFEKWCHELIGPEWGIYLTGKAPGEKKKTFLDGRRAVVVPELSMDDKLESTRVFQRYGKPDVKAAVPKDELPELDLSQFGL
jgi:hypothetical protein